MRSNTNSISLREHFEALRAADQRALLIEKEGREEALRLARDIQVHKDEKANELREQINSERGLYATKDEIRPLAEFVTGQRSNSQQRSRAQDRIQPVDDSA